MSVSYPIYPQLLTAGKMSDSSEPIPGVLKLFSLLHWDITITKKRDGFLKSPPQLTSNLLIPLLCHSPMKFRTRLIWSYYSSAAGPPSEICVGIFGHQLIPFLGIILLNFHHLLKLSIPLPYLPSSTSASLLPASSSSTFSSFFFFISFSLCLCLFFFVPLYDNYAYDFSKKQRPSVL